MAELLELSGVTKRYGALTVTRDLSFSLSKGEVLGVIGPNGAGKTTMFNLISGDTRPDAGNVFFKGSNITQMSPHRRCRLGIGRTYQVARPFEGMTVFENLLVGALFGAAGHGLSRQQERCAEILERTGLLSKANRIAGTLPLLDRKRLELARALATEPELILLDEIAGGLTECEARELVDLIRQIHQGGLAIIWIEHVIHALLAVASRVLVIDFGAKLADGDPREVMDSPAVKRVYMGIEV